MFVPIDIPEEVLCNAKVLLPCRTLGSPLAVVSVGRGTCSGSPALEVAGPGVFRVRPPVLAYLCSFVCVQVSFL